MENKSQMAPPLLFLKDIYLGFGGPALLEGAELAIGARERLCLVGRNGSGKSTLLKIAAGTVDADRGERIVQQGVSVQYLPQEPDLRAYPTTLAYVEEGFGEDDDPYRGRHRLNQLGLTGDEDPRTLSGGEARRAALARVLAQEPDILLLDEPTNHLDLPAIEWLENELRGLRSALVMVSHDRRFLTNLSRATVWLDRGVTRRLDRGFAEFETWRDEILEREEIERHKLDRKIATELDWVRHGVSARRKRNQGRLRALQGLRIERRDQRKILGAAQMIAATSELSPKLVLEAVTLSKSYDERGIVRDFTLRMLRGDRIGVVGPNGSGKTTLLRLLTGDLAPDAGALKLGANLDIVTIDQKRESLDTTKSLADVLTGGQSDHVTVGGQSRHVVGYLKDFLFTPDQANTPVRALSGGERGRLLLARALAQPSNFLVLDEPTNDLDLETLDLLQEMLADYDGTVLLVSHDRDFLDRVTTVVVAFEGHGRWQAYAGGYSDMVTQRGEGVTARKDERREGRSAKATRRLKSIAEDTAENAGRTMSAKRRLGFKQKHALKTLPAQIAALRAEIAQTHAKLDDPTLYARNADAFAAISTTLRAAEAALAEAEEEWLMLEILREEIEAEGATAKLE